MRLFKSVLVLAGLLSVPALAVSPTPTPRQAPLSSSDTALARQAIVDEKMEVELGRLALQRAHSEAVIQFAELMVEEHGKLAEALASLLKDRGTSAPSSMDEQGQRVRGHLASLQGDAFDAAYMQHMREEHHKAEVFFTHAKTSAKDPVLKKQAVKALAMVEEHQKLIDNIAPEQKAP